MVGTSSSEQSVLIKDTTGVAAHLYGTFQLQTKNPTSCSLHYVRFAPCRVHRASVKLADRCCSFSPLLYLLLLT